MTDRIPIAAAKRLADQYGCTQVLILAYDGERTHRVTYGKTKADCAAVAVAQDWWDGKVLPKVQA